MIKKVKDLNSESLNIVAIFAHPDDLTFYAAGTVAKWAEQGHVIYTICVTSGNLGTFRTDLTLEEVAETREKELRAANKILGVKDTIMLGYPDGGFIDGAKLRKELIYQVRKLRADRVITFDPWVKYEIHPDHVLVGRMAAEAAAFAGFPLLHPDQLEDGVKPYKCSEVWFMGLLGHKPNCYVDITPTFEKKVKAVLQFEATLSLIADLFAPGEDIDPANVSQKELKKLSKYANRLFKSFATIFGQKVEIQKAEAFYVQKVLPGHFDNFREIMLEMLGNPPEPPEIC
ncbi:MAG: PIG-L family deacetylase [Promethearchaeota archaeon]|nr:MAG: PIG-L family deacetylase [Candidatus Lokiarchaeota archaeon]